MMDGGVQGFLPRGVFATVINNQANIRVPEGSQRTQTVQSSQAITVSQDQGTMMHDECVFIRNGVLVCARALLIFLSLLSSSSLPPSLSLSLTLSLLPPAIPIYSFMQPVLKKKV